MSLINKMLQDLEKRGPEIDSESLPAGVLSAHPENRRRWPWLIVAGIAILLAGLAYFLPAKPRPDASPLQPTIVAEGKPAVDTPATVAASPSPEPPPAVSPPVLPAVGASSPTAKLASSERKKETRKDKRKKEREQARGKAKEQLAAKPKSVTGKIDKSPVQSEAQEMAEALYRQAALSFGQGRSNESAEKLRQSLLLDPAHASARQLLAKLLLEQRAYDEARKLLHEGVRQQPAQLQWATILARLELERGDANAARNALDASLGFAANSSDFQSLAGAVAQRQGKPGDAADFYRAALRVKPADGRSWVGLGLALEAEGHVAEAKEAFRRALGTESLNPELEGLAQRKSR